MKKMAAGAIALLLMSSPTLSMAALEDMTTLDVSAEAQVKAAPDVVLISAGVMTSAPTAAAAMQQNAEAMTSVAAALKTAGVPEKDVQTSGISLNAQYAYADGQAPRVTGYQANNTVNVTLYDLKNAGKVIDSLVAEGANQINGPTFSVENPDAALDKARTEAVRKAAKRAETYAAAMGLKVKRLISVSEQQMMDSGPRPMMMKAMAMDSAASTPVSPGQVSLGITVNAKYELTN